MYPEEAEKKNEIDLVFSYAVYSGGELAAYPTDQVKGDVTTTNTAFDSNAAFVESEYTLSNQKFTILSA